ncbi:MAG: alanine racemase [Candidatus Omnitrophota bacterium]
MRPLWIEVDLGALCNNFLAIKKFVGSSVKLVATVKQSAYGHGLIPVARKLSALGVDFLGVGSLEEAISLRKSGLKEPILILTSVLKEFAGYFVSYNITPTVVDAGFAMALNICAKKRHKRVKVHFKIDTGMGRLGPYYRDARKLVNYIRKFSNIDLEGAYTHFPAADTDISFTNYQIGLFNKFIRILKNDGVTFKYRHCANSIGIINYPQAHFNMVRPGIILYGIKPSSLNLPVRPVLSLKSKITFLKKVKKGMSVSYARSYISSKATRIATVAVGYADGYPWSLSGRSRVIIKNKSYPLAGRVCMDHCMADIGTRDNIKVGDEVILIGGEGKVSITAGELAEKAGTIPYEIVSSLSQKIPRFYKESSKK